MSVFVHPLSDVGECRIGEGTRIWQFAVVLDGARIGRDCNVNAHTFIEGDVVVGDRVTVKSGVYLWNGTTVEDDVFIGPNATFTNDPAPRSRHYPKRFVGATIRANASIGASATILPGVEIGAFAMIGAGAVVTRDVPPHALVIGSPARVNGHLCVCGHKLREMRCDACGAKYRDTGGRFQRVAGS